VNRLARRWWRVPRAGVRMRLTVVFTALFVGAGAGLLVLSYVLVNQREHRGATTEQVICGVSKDSVAASQQGPQPSIEAPTPNTARVPVNCSKTVKSGTGLVYFGTTGFQSGVGLIEPADGNALPAPSTLGGEPVQVLNQIVADSQAHTLHSLLVESSLGLGVMALLSLGLGWWLAGRVLRPVHRITDTARRLSERNLQERIRLDGPNDELKELGDTFDAMLTRLERAFHSQRRFVANASHELRTPLATERVLIDEALANREASPGELRSILEQLRLNSLDTEALIGALMTLARSERGLDRREPVDLASLARQVISRTGAPEALSRGVELQAGLRPAGASGDRGLLERLIGNLLENAIRHNVAGGWASISTAQDDEWSTIHVANSGPSLDPENLPALVEPFHRGQIDRTNTDGGFGLGLSIVEAIVAAHGGTLSLAALPAGGLQVKVNLPSGAPVGLDAGVKTLQHR
jgi:signal transduction histidine kinase